MKNKHIILISALLLCIALLFAACGLGGEDEKDPPKLVSYSPAEGGEMAFAVDGNTWTAKIVKLAGSYINFNDFKVSDGAEFSVYSDVALTKEIDIESEIALTLFEYYIKVFWTDEADNSQTYKIVFELIPVTIDFETNGGDKISPQELYFGDAIVLPLPTRSGYAFAGWYENSALTTPYSHKVVESVTESYTAYAKWLEPEIAGDFQFVVSANSATITGLSYQGSQKSELTLPSTLGGATVKAIGMYAFSNTPNLKKLIIPSGISPTTVALHETAFYGKLYDDSDDAFDIVVDASKVASFLQAQNWRDYAYLMGEIKKLEGVFFKDVSDTTYLINSEIGELLIVSYNGTLTGGVYSPYVSDAMKSSVVIAQSVFAKNAGTVTKITIRSNHDTVDLRLQYGALNTNVSPIFTIETLDANAYVFDESFSGYGNKISGENIDGVGASSVTVSIGHNDYEAKVSYTRGGDALTVTGVELVKKDGGDAENVPATYALNLTGIDLSAIGENCAFTAIADGAFKNNAMLTSVTLPASVKYIGNDAFSGCTALTSATMPGTEEIGNNAFLNTGLRSVTLTNTKIVGEAAFKNNKITSLSLSSTLSVIGKEAFADNATLTSLTMVNGLTYIGDSAFLGAKLTSLEFVDSVAYVGDNAFKGMTSLTSIKFSETGEMGYIGNNAFEGCVAVANMNFYALRRLQYVGDAAFKNVGTNVSNKTKLVLDIPASVAYIGASAFENCNFFGSINFYGASSGNPARLKTIGDNAFKGLSFAGTVILPSSVEKIGANAFKGMTGITMLMLGGSLTEVGVSAFEGCIGISGVLNIPTSLKTIGQYAFRNCTSLIEVNFQQKGKLTTIGVGSFQGCTQLKEVVIGENVTFIGNNAFSGCAITKIDIHAQVPPNVSQNSFGTVSDINKITAYVNDANALNAFTATGSTWRVIANFNVRP